MVFTTKYFKKKKTHQFIFFFSFFQSSYIVYIWSISHLLAMSHCSVNPFIYIWMNNKFRNGFKHIYFRLLALCGLTNNLQIQPSVHNYSIQTQLTHTHFRPFSEQQRLRQISNDNSNNSNEPIDVELALLPDNTDTNNNKPNFNLNVNSNDKNNNTNQFNHSCL